ncbi:hypothetical protein MINTMi27_15110 [Mycobacterium intracellulare]|uniref:hypothetical protein n=1 Tax=Mycobacterium intracellulare TaxID=1767 RepID=UPI0019277F7C|nr:hypothetical protein [Mycobacterium intracellulare]BCP41418.1 hypothetical protein MINTMi27_15110 [Mycobacterium intracellulare]
MQVETAHEINWFGLNHMTLTNTGEVKAIVVARRDSESEPWTISAEGAEDRVAQSRNDAIDEMIDLALSILPGTTYSTWVPGVQVGSQFVSLRNIA